MRLRLKLTNAGGEESIVAEIDNASAISCVKHAIMSLCAAQIVSEENGGGYDISWQLGDPDVITPGADDDLEGDALDMPAMVDRWLA